MAEAIAANERVTIADMSPRRHRGLWSNAFRRLARNRLALISMGILLAMIVLAILGNYVDWVQRYEPSAQDYSVRRAGPSAEHWFGTDSLGRDNWSRVLQGTWISLRVGLGVQAVVVVIGVLIGGTAALGGRWLDNLMMRLTDLAYAFPDLLFIILLSATFQGRQGMPIIGDPLFQMILAISFVAWVTIARLVRGQMLALSEQDFVTAARATGLPEWRIVFQHMLPNALGPLIVAIVFGIPLAIFAEAVLGFIGIGMPPPTASLGVLVSNGYDEIRTNIWLIVFPAGTIAIMMLCFTFLGDGLRDALDPRARE
ncbi:MAG: ABC transporter permease [Dehalococcoidia bacterium]|nr:ABC transporter permease [Dehalococcoidia bacterium]MCA9824539.1 ABC transporter permease [Dehalococcoidia bacterium]MCA9843357.1 ABC transporter permease [Dehalococcoidia bacterium]MCA9853916.1 ABC transporter permease [Dehalococcoidia bacterium]